jgi:HK97 family phage portal protein
MSILFREQPAERVQLPPGYGGRDVVAEMRGSSAVSVTNDSAMRHTAVWSCRTRIAEDVSMMPVDVVRYVGGRRQPVDPVPQIVAAPSTVAKPWDWVYQIVMAWTGHGNAWGLITRFTPDGRYPMRVELRDQDQSLRFEQSGDQIRIFVDGVEEYLWPVGRLWHSPAYPVPGRLLGLSPIQHHATTIGKGMAAGLHGFQYFTDGAHPTSVWRLKGANSTQATAFKERLMSLARGNREPLTVDGDAVDMVKLQSNPSDSQFLETEKYAFDQVCSIYNCDPADHGSSGGGPGLTYANRSDADLARLKRRQYWITKLQNEWAALLPDGMKVKLNASAFLMMTAKERHEIHKLRLESKTATINEVRRVEDEEPFDGDEYDQPGVPAGSTAEAEIERQAIILQKMYLSVGVVITPMEARKMAIKAGIELDEYDPALLGATPQPSPIGGSA